MPGQSLRRHKRHNLIVYLKVFDQSNGELLGHLVDVTHEGLMIMTEEPLPIGDPYRLRIDTGDKHGPRRFLDLEAESLWIKRDVNPRLYNIGFHLTDTSPDALSSIDNLIMDLGFAD